MTAQSLGIEVKSRRLFEVCTITVFNELGVKVKGTPIRYDDTEATYDLSVDEKLNKAKTLELTAFLRGVIACWKSAF